MSYYGNFRTRTFANIFPDYTTFNTWHTGCGVPQNLLTGTNYANYNLSAIYFLLISYYANSHIKSADENRFKLQMSAIIYECAPQWQREMYLQNKILTLTDDEVLSGSKAIYNHAQHPDTSPITTSTTALDYIDDQNVTNYQKDKLKGYVDSSSYFDTRICKRFVDRFKPLFLSVLYTDEPVLYTTEGEN